MVRMGAACLGHCNTKFSTIAASENPV